MILQEQTNRRTDNIRSYMSASQTNILYQVAGYRCSCIYLIQAKSDCSCCHAQQIPWFVSWSIPGKVLPLVRRLRGEPCSHTSDSDSDLSLDWRVRSKCVYKVLEVRHISKNESYLLFSGRNKGPPESPWHVPFPSPNAQISCLKRTAGGIGLRFCEMHLQGIKSEFGTCHL